MDDIVKRLREPPFGTETSERNVMAYAADEIGILRKMLRDQFEGWHDPDCKFWRENVNLCTCGHDEVKAALAGTEHKF